MTFDVFRPMTAGEIIGQSFQLYKAHLAALVTIALLPNAVALLFEVALQAAAVAPAATLALLLLGTAILHGVALAAITHAVAIAVRGGEPTVGEVYGRTFRGRLPGVVATYALSALLTSAGLLALIVPGVILGGLLAPVIPIYIVERQRPFAAISRSLALMREALPKGMLIFLFVLTISGVLPVGLQLLVGLGPLTPLLGAVIGALVLPLAYTTNVLLYLTQRAAEGAERRQLEAELER
ncbi:MAG: hypothetical protein HY423_13330 [Candidatus Lambdaproteobacteria bacterium]|nr:hypothetical protein [Candidatus Lambdaproteobacteria bacterium]